METTDFLLGLCALLVSLAVYCHIKAFSFWKERGLPGPTPWPIFGTNIYYLFCNKIELDQRWRDKYGRTYGLYEGYSPVLRTTDSEVIKQIYVKQFQSFTDRNNTFVFGDNVRRWLFWTKGDLWANQRALVSPMFTASKMRSMVPIISESVQRLVNYIERLRNSTNTKQAVKLSKFDLSALTLDVIASSFFGLKLDTYKTLSEPDEFINAAYNLADFNFPRFIVWLFMPRQLAALLKFDIGNPKRFQYFDSLGQKIATERRKSASKRDDIIQALIDAKLPEERKEVFTTLDDKEAHYSASAGHKELESIQQEQTRTAKHFRSFSDIEIRGQITFFFIAGFETTASTISFAFHELAHQPKIQETILAELKDVFGHEGEKFFSNDPKKNYELLLDMKYLDAFISEVLRIYSPLLEHSRMVTSKEGAVLNVNGKDIFLPTGVPISTNGFILQRDPEYFENPNELRVERFFPENRDRVKTGTYMPFGLGPRYCVGMRLALSEVKFAIAEILLRYEIIPVENGEYPPRFKQNTVFLQYHNTQFKLVPRKG